jgi:hypothetical protein
MSRHCDDVVPLSNRRSLCYSNGACAMGFRRFPGSSVVEQPAVNRLVAGSNPARGANTPFADLRLLSLTFDKALQPRHFHDFVFRRRSPESVYGRLSFVGIDVGTANSHFPLGTEPKRPEHRVDLQHFSLTAWQSGRECTMTAADSTCVPAPRRSARGCSAT